MTKTIKLMCVHGLGDQRLSGWEQDWTKALQKAFAGIPDVSIQPEFVTYDDIFADEPITLADTMKALVKLSSSAIASMLPGQARRRGFVNQIPDKVRWSAGYVVTWVEEARFRRATRARILHKIRELEPDYLLGHSLGSLITFDALTHGDAQRPDVVNAVRQLTYVTLGSQLANPFVVRNLTPGRIEMPPVHAWYHLYNEHDSVFTRPIVLHGEPRFRQVATRFDEDGFADHSAVEYIRHPAAVADVWSQSGVSVSARGSSVRGGNGGLRRTASPSARARPRTAEHKGTKRALLVGIDHYPDPRDCLEGCVNDVYRMSEVLQEGGFPASSIRVCVNERASTQAILERLEWLLADPQPGDQRVFYFSGHGTQIPEYGEDGEPDRYLETLVPFDFDWSQDRAITDDTICQLYSQLPYDTRFAMILDCCHAGGMHKQGGPRVRGIAPPDDIRHRELKWDVGQRMWVPREFRVRAGVFASSEADRRSWFGERGASVRLGRAASLRGLTGTEYRREKRRRSGTRFGPYLPLIIQACRENQTAQEYRHGSTSFGAFTYALSDVLRSSPRALSFDELVAQTAEKLAYLEYEQVPQVLGPEAVRSAPVPWRGDAAYKAQEPEKRRRR